MPRHAATSIIARSGIILCCLIFAACLGGGGATKVNYYLVDPETPANAEIATGRQLAIELIDLHIPQYLQRFQMVTRDGDNRLRFSDSNQWAENLRKNLLRTMAVNLATRLSTIDIGDPLNRSASPPDYRVHVHIGKFELDSKGLVQLSGRWQLSSADEEELGMHFAVLQSPDSIDTSDFDQVVADMQVLFGEFCDQIAASILALEDGQ
ncbi:MAG: hypothetical protein GKR93_04945 [Gammaproteobacteria bacterium]|nr:hypothetical protein [Gammaproteobacteria bacterium]